MSEQGRTRLPVDSFLGHANALAIAVSPVNSSVAAVALTPGVGGAAAMLLRDMVTQPLRVTGLGRSDQLTFAAAGATLYGLNDHNGILDQWQVLTPALSFLHAIRASHTF